MKIQYLGHSAFALQSGKHTVLIDPFFAGNPKRAQALQQFIGSGSLSHIITTHGHDDHVGSAPELAKQYRAPIVAVAELAGLLGKEGCPVISCGVGGKLNFDWGWSRFVPAVHSSSYRGQYSGNAVGVVLNIGGVTVYHTGDTCLFGDMKLIGEMHHPQVALLPIGSCYTMDIAEAVRAASFVGAEWVIPMHYNTFPAVNADPQEFKRQIEADNLAKVHIMNIEEAWEI